jgi:hypothetical protein
MARLFNGSTDNLTANNDATSTYPITMAAWFRPDVINNDGALVSIGNNSSNNNHFSLEARGGTPGDPVRARTSASSHRYAVTTTGFSANTWHHACGVWTSSSSVDAYIDGGSKGSVDPGITPVSVNETTIGQIANSSNSNRFDGRVAEVGIWNVALSLEEINALARGVSPLKIRRQNLVAYYPLYGNGAQEPELAGNSLDLDMTVTGAIQADHAPVATAFGFDEYTQQPTEAGEDKTLTAETGVFTLTGIDTNPRAERQLPVSKGTFTFTGISAPTVATRQLPASEGVFSLTGIDADTITARKLPASEGTFALTGISPTITKGRTVTAAKGAFALSGINPTITKGRTVATEEGVFTLTGIDAGLIVVADKVLTADTGTFAFTGIDANLVAARKLSAAEGVFTLTGTSTPMVADRQLPAAEGVFTLTGIDVDLIKVGAFTLMAEVGVFTLSGVSTPITADRQLPTSTGVFALVGVNPTITRDRTITASSGAFALTGISTAMIADRILTAIEGAFTLNGLPVGLPKGRTLTTSRGVFTLTGIDVGLDKGYILSAAEGVFTLTGIDVTLTSTAILHKKTVILDALVVQIGSLPAVTTATRVLLLPSAARKHSPYAGLISGTEEKIVEDTTHVRYELDVDLILLKKGRDIEEMLASVETLLYANTLATDIGALQVRVIGQEEVALIDVDSFSSTRIVMTITYVAAKGAF